MISLPALILTLFLASPPSEHAPHSALADKPPVAPSAVQAAADLYANNACVQCHRHLAGRSAEIVDLEWANSVHFENNVACDGCHGGDASLRLEHFPSEEALKQASHQARNPEFLLLYGGEERFVSRARGRSISYFCGRCHSEIMEKHLGSPHGNFGDPSCLFCHGQGSHAIKPPDVNIIDTRPRSEAGRCSLCHQASTMKTVAKIKDILKNTAQLIDSSAEEFHSLEEMGYRNLALAEAHHHTEETHSRLRRVFHSFNMREINGLTRAIESVAERTDHALALVDSLHAARANQTLVGLGAAALLLLLAAVLVYYKHAFCEDYDRNSAIPEEGPTAAAEQ